MTTGGLRTRRREDLCRRREELKPRIIELRAAGRTWDNIAAELGASRSVLCRIVGPDEDPAHKPKSPRPKPLAPEELAAQAVSLHEQGLSAWSISRTLGMLFRVCIVQSPPPSSASRWRAGDCESGKRPPKRWSYSASSGRRMTVLRSRNATGC